MSLPSHEAARSWPGLTALDPDGDTVGRITHIYLDRDSGQPEWALVAMPERGRVFVPLAGARAAGDRVLVSVARAAVREAPDVASGRELAGQDEARLYRHYGVANGADDHGARRAASGGGRARGAATSAPARRLLSAAGAASALGAAAAAVWRSRRRRRGGLAGTLDDLLAVPSAAFRRRRRRQRVRAAGRLLGSTATAPVQAVGNLGAELSRRVPVPPRPLSRRRRSKMAGNFKLAAGLATGYVLGTRAGRERYERLREVARQVADRPEVQQLTGKLRSGLETGVDKAANTASDRLERARSAGTTRSGERSQADQESRAGERSWAGQEPRAPESASAGQDEERERERSSTRVRR
jgi:hypothetical protein